MIVSLEFPPNEDNFVYTTEAFRRSERYVGRQTNSMPLKVARIIRTPESHSYCTLLLLLLLYQFLFNEIMYSNLLSAI